jgi:hypothetical protein
MITPTRFLAARARAEQGDTAGDAGFVLIYVLMIISIVTVLVGSVLVIAASSVVPSVQSAYDNAADAAAQAGIQDLQARANSLCTGNNSTPSACGPLLPSSLQNTWIPITQPTTGYTTEFKWTYTVTPGGYLRVTSTGKVIRGGVSATKSLVADLAGGTSTSCFDYSSCTQYETQSPDVMSQTFAAGRSITLDPAFLAKADAAPGASGTSVTWNGPTTSNTAGSVSVCNTPYSGSLGREANPAPAAATPYVDWSETGSIGATGVREYQPCQVSLGSSTKLLAPTTTANGVGGYTSNDALLFSNSNPGSVGGPVLNQPVYSTYSGAADPTGVAGQNYRSFTLPGYVLPVGGAPASGSTYPSPQTVTAVPGAITTAPSVPANSCVYKGPTRVLLNSNGTATITSPQTTAALSSSPSGCYPTSFGGGIYQWTSGALSSISGFSGVISVQDSGSAPTPTPTPHTSTGWPTTGQKAYTTIAGVTSATTPSAGNTAFYMSSAAASQPDTPTTTIPTSGCTGTNPVATPTCGWNEVVNPPTQPNGINGWSAYSSAKQCWAVSRNQSTPNGPKPTDEQTFDCDWFNQMGQNWLPPTTPGDGYSLYRAKLQADLASSSTVTINGNGACASQTFVPAAATSQQMVCLIQHDLRQANTAGQEPNWSSPNNLDRQYIAAAATPVTTSTTQAVGTAPSVNTTGDKFFDNGQTGTTSSETVTTTTTTYTVGSQAYACYGVLVLGLCLLNVGGPLLGYQWGDGTTALASTPQFQVTITQKTYSNFQQGNAAIANFPSMKDVTQYGTGTGGATGTTSGPGDLYVEGAPTSSLALVAANDVVVTGSLNPSSPSNGIEIAARDNVRVYHPVSCLSTATPSNVALTTAGYCPNDLTGLYNAIPAAGFRPYEQYSNLRSDLSGLTINAAIFALAQKSTGALCPQWFSSGLCGGEFTVDNYNRGATLSALAVTGTVFQEHHGALGEEWEVPDTAGQTRPNSGYTLSLQYQNLKTALNSFSTLLATGTTIASLWHVVSTSTGP